MSRLKESSKSIQRNHVLADAPSTRVVVPFFSFSFYFIFLPFSPFTFLFFLLFRGEVELGISNVLIISG